MTNPTDADLLAIDWSTVNLMPPTTGDRSEAAEAIRHRGAVVITDVAPGAEAARQLAVDIFGDRVVAVPEAARVTDGGEKDRKPDGLDHTTRSRGPHRRLRLRRSLPRPLPAGL